MPNLPKVNQPLINPLYSFDNELGKYGLSSANICFFRPFKSLSDVQQLIKTTLVSPLIGLFTIVSTILRLIKDILLMAISISCMSPNLFKEGFVEGRAAVESIIVTPFITAGVTLASLLSLVTRSFATVFSCVNGKFEDDSLSAVHEAPYPSICRQV